MPSKGEQFISKLLKQSSIPYEAEKAMCGLKHDGFSLRFDFYLPARNIAIEFDGIQHYKPIPRFGGETGLRKQKENDRRKNRFCLANNISLYRIPYWAITQIHTAGELFQPQYLVQSQWHNDRICPPNGF